MLNVDFHLSQLHFIYLSFISASPEKLATAYLSLYISQTKHNHNSELNMVLS